MALVTYQLRAIVVNLRKGLYILFTPFKGFNSGADSSGPLLFYGAAYISN